MKVNVYSLDGKQNGDFAIADQLLAKNTNPHLIFEQVICENAANRQGTHSTLTKGEVRGGGRKPRPQKHTGNARQGSTRNPHWVGGGVAFGPRPNRNYKLYLNRKANINALKSAITYKLNENAVSALEDEQTKAPSTKKIVALIKTLNVSKKLLIITNSDIIIKSANNIRNVSAKKPENVSVRDVINAQYLLIQKKSFEQLIRKVSA